MGLDALGIGSIADFGGKILDKIFPDKADADKAKFALFELQQKGELQDLNNEFQLKIEEFKDRANARDNQSKREQATGHADYFLYILATWCVIAPIGIISYLLYKGLPTVEPGVAALIGGFVGIIIGEYKTITGYFFGTTKSSKDKTDMIFNSAPVDKK